MPSQRYKRLDLALTLATTDEGLLELQHDTARLRLDPRLPEPELLIEIQRWLEPRVPPAWRRRPSSGFVLRRLTVGGDEGRWPAIEWERLVARRISGRAVVRVSRVLPRARQAALTLPIRVLEIGTKASVEGAVNQILSGSADRTAVEVQSSPPASARSQAALRKWATVHILHVHSLALSGDLLRTSAVDVTGTLGWLLRTSLELNTRLIVLDAPEAPLEDVRQLGQQIVDRAGPAVAVLGSGAKLVGFYASLFHDRPLDWTQTNVPGITLFAGAGREEDLRFSAAAQRLAQMSAADLRSRSIASARRVRVATMAVPQKGGGFRSQDIAAAVRLAAKHMRMEVRARSISLGYEDPTRRIRFGENVAANLMERGYVVRPLDIDVTTLSRARQFVALQTIVNRVAKKAYSFEHVMDPDTAPHFEELVLERLKNLETSVQDLHFEVHEGNGTLPVSIKTANIRDLVGTWQRLEPLARRRRLRAGAAAPAPAPRQVNARFYAVSDTERAVPIPQVRGLAKDEVVHLGIRVGAADVTLVNLGSVALDEAAFSWKPRQTGCWIDIGVTPLDFDLFGAPVQDVWLPREGDTQLVMFALKPKAETALAGIARARFTIYNRNNVVQSFRIAARLAGDDRGTTARLAEALGARELPLDDLAYATRLEYGAGLDDVEAMPPRALSIVANDSVGQKVFTVKGLDVFSSTVNAGVSRHVQNARTALLNASYDQALDEYRFGTDNSTARTEILDRLWEAARSGWRLYQQIVPDGSKRQEIANLLGEEGVVHAAHIDLRQLIPWSLIYDLPIDDGLNKVTVQQSGSTTTYPVKKYVCEAGLPAADASLPPQRCGDAPACLLHGASSDGRKLAGGEMLCRETIVCPRHFWGFAHQIEVPAEQPGGAVATVTRAPAIITAKAPASLVMGYNPNFKLIPAHLTRLQSIANANIATPIPTDRNDVIGFLKSQQPDLVYLYCHAFEKTAAGDDEPNLDFGSRQTTDIVAAAELDGPHWTNHPLVFINGCSSVGFSPLAPSGFVTTLIQGRKASAVIGTEVTVWEQLATEVAESFFEAFLGAPPMTAGAALTRARRKLLLKNNPLGLVYTLYGSADLRVKW